MLGNFTRPPIVKAAGWILGVIVTLLGLLAWGNTYQWHVWPLSTYQLFPVLGIVAFSLMWTHYVLGFWRRLSGFSPRLLATYNQWSGYVVLLLICLHPGLLIYQRYRDGYGLPPHSYETYVAPGLGWVTILGSVSLLVFLAYEFRRFFGHRSWWHYVVSAGDIAMLAIAYHALRLGSTFSVRWFYVVWIIYTVTLVAMLGYKYYMIVADKRLEVTS